MATTEIPIRIQEDPYTRVEQFKQLAPEIEIGNQGTIRIQNYSFTDGQAVYLDINGLKIRRDAGFQKPLLLTKPNADTRVYFFRCFEWYQQTTTPNRLFTPLQKKVGLLGFWPGLYEWLLDVGDTVDRVLGFLLAPLVVVPSLLFEAVRYLAGLCMLIVVCLAIWRLIFWGLASLLFG